MLAEPGREPESLSSESSQHFPLWYYMNCPKSEKRSGNQLLSSNFTTQIFVVLHSMHLYSSLMQEKGVQHWDILCIIYNTCIGNLQNICRINYLILCVKMGGLLFLCHALANKSPHVPGHSTHSHFQMTSHLNIPYLKDLQESGLGGITNSNLDDKISSDKN